MVMFFGCLDFVPPYPSQQESVPLNLDVDIFFRTPGKFSLQD
jgi:hypothetical protein